MSPSYSVCECVNVGMFVGWLWLCVLIVAAAVAVCMYVCGCVGHRVAVWVTMLRCVCVCVCDTVCSLRCIAFQNHPVTNNTSKCRMRRTPGRDSLFVGAMAAHGDVLVFISVLNIY